MIPAAGPLAPAVLAPEREALRADGQWGSVAGLPPLAS